MNRFQRIHGSHSPIHQQNLRVEISRQVDEFLQRGGRIERLAGPSFQPHREVRINNAEIKGGV